MGFNSSIYIYIYMYIYVWTIFEFIPICNSPSTLTFQSRSNNLSQSSRGYLGNDLASDWLTHNTRHPWTPSPHLASKRLQYLDREAALSRPRILSPVVNFNERITSHLSTSPYNILSHKWTCGFVKSTIVCCKQAPNTR